MYNKSIAITGCTIEKTTKYDRFREDKIRMELYRIILSFYDEGYRTFTCNLHSYIGLLGADTIIMLREADRYYSFGSHTGNSFSGRYGQAVSRFIRRFGEAGRH